MKQKNGFTLIELPVVRKRGFTLIELLVVIMIIMILAALVIVAISENRNKLKLLKSSSDMNTVVAAMEMYYDVNKKYPDDEYMWGTMLYDPEFQKYLTTWPISQCPGLVYDWENWPSHNKTYPDFTPWAPVVRISLRRADDDTTIFYKCLKYNQKSECTCNAPLINEDGSPATTFKKGYCMGYQSIDEISDKKLTCSDLLNTVKFPSLLNKYGSDTLPDFTPQ